MVRFGAGFSVLLAAAAYVDNDMCDNSTEQCVSGDSLLITHSVRGQVVLGASDDYEQAMMSWLQQEKEEKHNRDEVTSNQSDEVKQPASGKTATSDTDLPAAYTFFDGETVMEAQLHKIYKSFPTEFLFSYDINGNGIKVTDTHVFLPTWVPLQASYIRHMKGMGDKEVGVTKQYFFPQPKGSSIMGPDVTAGYAEKMHGFKRKLPLDTTAYERAKSHVSNGTIPPDYTLTKYGMVVATGLASRNGPQMLYASGMGNSQIKSAADGGAVNRKLEKKEKRLRQRLRIRLDKLNQKGKLADPILSTVNCMHWDGVSEDSIDGVPMLKFPLETKISTYRAHTVSSPFTAFELLQGVSFVNKADGRVNIYFGASLHAHWPDPLDEDRNPARIWHGPANGFKGPPVTLSVFNPIPKSPLAKHIFDQVRNMEKDYTFLFLPEHILCSPTYKSLLQEKINYARNTSLVMKCMSGQATPEEEQIFVKLVAASVPCAANFLKPDHLDSAEFGLYMSSALIHAILEVPLSKFFDSLGRQDWQEYDQNRILLT